MALRPLHRFLAGKGGARLGKVKNSLKCLPATLPDFAPRRIRGVEANAPVRINSDGTGLGNFARYSFLGRGIVKHPIPVTGSADHQFGKLAQETNNICLFELFATVATFHKFRRQLIGRRPIIFVDNNAPRGALTGTDKDELPLILIYSLWTLAAK